MHVAGEDAAVTDRDTAVPPADRANAEWATRHRAPDPGKRQVGLFVVARGLLSPRMLSSLSLQLINPVFVTAATSRGDTRCRDQVGQRLAENIGRLLLQD